MEPTEVIAANVRARLAWHKVSQEVLRSHLRWSARTVQNKVHATTPISAVELAKIAELFGLDDPGPLYRVPESFGTVTSIEVSESAWIAIGLLAA